MCTFGFCIIPPKNRTWILSTDQVSNLHNYQAMYSKILREASDSSVTRWTFLTWINSRELNKVWKWILQKKKWKKLTNVTSTAYPKLWRLGIIHQRSMHTAESVKWGHSNRFWQTGSGKLMYIVLNSTLLHRTTHCFDWQVHRSWRCRKILR